MSCEVGSVDDSFELRCMRGEVPLVELQKSLTVLLFKTEVSCHVEILS